MSNAAFLIFPLDISSFRVDDFARQKMKAENIAFSLNNIFEAF